MARTPHPQPHPGGDAGGVRRRTHDLNARVRQFVPIRHVGPTLNNYDEDRHAMARTPHPRPHPGGDAGGVRRRTHDLNARVRQFVGGRHRPGLVPLVTLLAVVAVIAGARTT